VRFLFVDRIVTLEPGRSIETLKNVSTSEDVFEDHFPGYPILPGAMVVEAFEQASQLLIGVSHDFTRTGHLRAVRRGAFRHFVRPGDQLRVRCARMTGAQDARPTGAQDAYPTGAQGAHPTGAQGAHPTGAQGARPAGADDGWTVDASAEVDGRRVASAVLELAIVLAEGTAAAHAARVREMARQLRTSPIELARGREAL
jgi:hypothetical protein